MLDEGRVVFTGSVAEARQSDQTIVHSFFHPGWINT
jgi:ABC-type transporter Mla maintaining outer membrane lipid asymmetry ATPase subunit MlaF